MEKIDPMKRADILILRGLGYSITEIADKLNTSPQLVSYHLNKFKERAEKVGYQWAFVEILLSRQSRWLKEEERLRLVCR